MVKPILSHPALLSHAVSLLANRLHGTSELRGKLMRLLLRQQTRAAVRSARAPGTASNDDPAPTEDDASPGPAPPPPAALASAVIAELQQRGLLDDAAYAAWHAAQRAAPSGRPRSRAQLGAELHAKQLPPELVRAQVRAHSELAACAAAALRKPSLRGPRLGAHLAWKGFPFWAIERVRAAREEEGALGALLEQERARAGGGEEPPLQ